LEHRHTDVQNKYVVLNKASLHRSLKYKTFSYTRT